MTNLRIAFFDAKPYDIASFNEVNKNFGFEIQYFETHLNSATAILAHSYQVVCAFVNDILDKDTIKALKQHEVQLVALRCAGYNNVDLKFIYNQIKVVRVPAYSPYAVAEHAVALLLVLNRKIHIAYNRVRDLNFNINGLLGYDIHNKTIGVIGTGRIGQVFIAIMKGFGANIIAHDPFPDTKLESSLGFKYVECSDLLKQSDIISLHCPLTKETTHLINKETINLMKNGVTIINTSRGKLIDSLDLIEGLKSQKIGAAGLDVYEEESEYFYEDYSSSFISDDTLARLLTFPNVIITSHQGFFTKEALANIAAVTLSSIKDFSQGKVLANEICYKC